MSDFTIADFEAHDPPLFRGNVHVLANFQVETGCMILPGFALAIAQNGQIWLLKPRAADRAYRMRFDSPGTGIALLDAARAEYERSTGVAPEDVNPAETSPREAYQQEMQNR